MPNFFINVKEKGAKKAAGNIKSLTGSMKMMALQAVTVTAVVQGLKKSIQMSAEMEGVKRGFDNLAKSQGFSTQAFDKFKDATDGTIDSLTLMKQANNAMLLGITDSEDQMSDMFDVAQRLGQSLGIDTTQAIESLVTGLGRQSKLMLDNLGIMVDTNKAYKNYADSIGKTTSQLTDQDRKTAFVNAAMREANGLVAQLGEEQLTTKDAMAQAATAVGDLGIKFGDILAPHVIKVAEALTAFMEGTEAFLDWTDGVDSATEALERLDFEANRSQQVFDEISRGMGKTDTVNQSLIMNMMDLREEMEEMIEQNAADNIFLKLVDGMGFTRSSLNRLNIAIERYMEDILVAAENSEPIIVSMAKLRDTSQEYLDNLQKIPEQIFSASLAQETAIATEMKLKKTRKEAAKDFGSNIQTMAKAFPEMEKAGKRAAQVQALVDAYASANAAFKAMAGIPVVGPALGATAAVAALGAGLANVKMIESAATGADFVTSGPQMMMVGDNPGGQEQVSVTPLSSPNIEGPQGGGSVTVNVSGNVLSQDFVEGELAENIKEAIRRGTDFGIS